MLPPQRGRRGITALQLSRAGVRLAVVLNRRLNVKCQLEGPSGIHKDRQSRLV